MKMAAALALLVISTPALGQFDGIWATPTAQEACAQLQRAEDAYHSGGGILALRGNRYISQEEDCTFRLSRKSCCDDEGEETRSGTLICGRQRLPIIFHRKGDALTVAIYDTGISGPSLHGYVRCRP